jgi:hypothetical protein
MIYSANDLERASRVLADWYATNHGYMSRERFAQELATVRREALEEAALEVLKLRDRLDVVDRLAQRPAYVLHDAVIAIRALMAPKEPSP